MRSFTYNVDVTKIHVTRAFVTSHLGNCSQPYRLLTTMSTKLNFRVEVQDILEGLRSLIVISLTCDSPASSCTYKRQQKTMPFLTSRLVSRPVLRWWKLHPDSRFSSPAVRTYDREGRQIRLPGLASCQGRTPVSHLDHDRVKNCLHVKWEESMSS